MSAKREHLENTIELLLMDLDPDCEDGRRRRRAREAVDDILQALETPDEMMVDAGAQMILGNRIDDGATAEAHFAEAWRAAIRAARAEP